jgi:hypothetical protein
MRVGRLTRRCSGSDTRTCEMGEPLQRRSQGSRWPTGHDRSLASPSDEVLGPLRLAASRSTMTVSSRMESGMWGRATPRRAPFESWRCSSCRLPEEPTRAGGEQDPSRGAAYRQSTANGARRHAPTGMTSARSAADTCLGTRPMMASSSLDGSPAPVGSHRPGAGATSRWAVGSWSRRRCGRCGCCCCRRRSR